jgi:Zn-dependent protease
MLFGNLSVEGLLASLLVLLNGMTIHEFAHSYVGYRMGDPTPARMGRLTLNPFVHINWIGWLMFALIGFGILGSAPISPWNMPRENRRWRWLAAVAAGPLSNLLLAVLFALIIRILGVGTVAFEWGRSDIFLLRLLATLLLLGVQLNVLLFVFNLLPLFPIDGWQIVYALLPPTLATEWEKCRDITQYVFFGLLIFSFIGPRAGLPNPLGLLIGQPVSWLFGLLLG